MAKTTSQSTLATHYAFLNDSLSSGVFFHIRIRVPEIRPVIMGKFMCGFEVQNQ